MANDVCSAFECHTVHLRHVRTGCAICFVLFLKIGIVERRFAGPIYKLRADRRQRGTKNALVSLSGRHYKANGYGLGGGGRRKSTRDESQGRAFIPSPLWREKIMNYFVYWPTHATPPR